MEYRPIFGCCSMVQTDLSMNRNKIDNILVARTKEFYVLSSPAATLRPRPSPGQQSRPSTLHIVVKNEAKWRQNFAILILFSLVITYLVSGGISDGQGQGSGQRGAVLLRMGGDFIYCSWLLVTFFPISITQYNVSKWQTGSKIVLVNPLQLVK